MAVVQQYLFTSNRDYGILHIECNGKANLYMHHCFDDDDNLYVSTQDYQGSRNYTGYGGGKMTPTAILKINSKTGQVIWQKHVDMWKGGGSNRGIDIDTSGNLYSVHSTSSLIPYSPPKPDTQIVEPGVEYELLTPSAFNAATVITSSKFFVSSISTPVQDKI